MSEEIPKPELGDLTYPKGFNAHKLTAVEVEAYCLGYAQCQSDTRTMLSDMMQEIILLRSEVRESRKSEVGTKKRMRSSRMAKRKNYLKDELRKRATESMVGIKLIKGKTSIKYKVNFISNGVRHQRTFTDLDLAIEYRNEYKYVPQIKKLDSTLTKPQLDILKKARKIRQSMLNDVAREDQQRKHGHTRAMALHEGYNGPNKKSQNAKKDVDEL